MRVYLNENIYSENHIFYYEEEAKIIKITERNWHNYLCEYGWEKINKKWIVKLNKLSNVKKKNSYTSKNYNKALLSYYTKI